MMAGARQRPRLAELIAGASGEHQAAVAEAIGLDREASGSEIVAALRQPSRLGRLVAELDDRTSALLGGALLGLIDGSPSPIATYGSPAAEALELERRGLAFAFDAGYRHLYVIPDELAPGLRRALAGRLTERLAEVEPAASVAAPLGLADDAAALAAHLNVFPPRLKQDGDLYVREWPKLAAALPEAGLGGAPGASALLASMRTVEALRWLGLEGLLETRDRTKPGGAPYRELTCVEGVAEAFRRTAEELREAAVEQARLDPTAQATLAIAARQEGCWLDLEALGEQFDALLEGCRLYRSRIRDNEAAGDEAARIGLVALSWLAGQAEIGVDESGHPAAVRYGQVDLPEASGPVAVCQANFEVVLLRRPLPLERFLLSSLCEPGEGQEHVMRLSRERITAAERERGPAGSDEHAGALAALRTLVGELPQNVERSIGDWLRGVRRPLRLRTAMMIEVEAAAEADELAGALGDLVVERIGSNHLAIDAGRLARAEAAIGRAGHELAPGLDRISGTWSERPEWARGRASSWCAGPTEAQPLPGRQTSTVGWGEQAEPPGLSGDSGSFREGAEDLAEPLQTLWEALDYGYDLDIVYSGAKGTTMRRVTPAAIDGARLTGYCHLRRAQRSFWLRSIVEAELVEAEEEGSVA